MSLYYPLLDAVPDFTEPVTMGVQTMQDRLSLAPALSYAAFPHEQTDRFFSYKFTGTSTGEIIRVKEFFRDRGGRTHPFYVPSWRADLVPLAVIPAGSNQFNIELVDDGYAAEHLTDTKEDHYGRQLFFWMPGTSVFAERVLRVIDVDAESETIELVEPLPFEFDPSKGLCGFAYLARFMEENLSWQHTLPDIATTTLRIRAIRGWNGITQENATEDNDQYGSPGFQALRQVQQLTEPVTNRVAYAPGPFNLRYVQEDPYSQQWAAYPGEFRVMLYQGNDTIWLPADVGAGSVLFDDTVDTDHMTLAFDQNSSEVIAYQKADGVTIEVRRLFNGDLETVTFEGQDPLLIFNGLIDASLVTGDTDVVLYYIKPGRNILYWRFQRENFGTERECCQLGGKPIALKRTWVELDDEEHRLEYLDAGFRSATLAVVADPPVIPPITHVMRAFREAVDAGTLTFSARYLDAIVLEVIPPGDAGIAGSMLLSGSYAPVTLRTNSNSTDTANAGRLTLGGVYVTAIVLFNTGHEYALAGRLLLSGVHEEVIVAPDPNSEYVTAGRLTLSGIYELP